MATAEVMHEIFGTDDDSEASSEGYESHDNSNANPENQIMHNSEEDDVNDEHEDAFDEMVRDGPKKGMVFNSVQRLYEAYNSFAKVHGFYVICRSNGDKYGVFSCYRSGPNTSQKLSKRTDCKAHINTAIRDLGRLEVTSVRLDHNHDLDPNMSQLMPGHRRLTMKVKRRLEANDIAGAPISKNIRMVEVEAGPENLGATERDCRNFIDQRRRLRLGEGDAPAIRNLFVTMQRKDGRFFHLMDIDDDCTLRNVMWIHPRSIAAYNDFHDVISFDTTYLVNRYQMPLATVVGVNHHHQSILLGCALLSNENSSSFEWFFENWLEAMGGVHPKAILTDQCESIKIAVRKVMPNTVHRFCIWHICEKLPAKIKGVVDRNKCKKEFYSVIYDSLSIVEFEERWAGFLLQHGLQSKRWFKDLYAEREHWVPIYLNHLFWAGMKSTQRSESMNAFFDTYINSKSTLTTFVEGYEMAVHAKVKKEVDADYNSKTTTMKPVSKYTWEGQFARTYTLKIYELFQNEIKKICNCNVEVVVDGEDVLQGIEKFRVLEMSIDRNEYHRQYTFIVEYRPVGEHFSCNCRKFESMGILCVHVLKVLVFRDFQHVNERYILARWRKDVFRPHSSIVFTGGYPHMTEDYKAFQKVERYLEECADLAYRCPEKLMFIEEKCIEMKNALIKWAHVVTAASGPT